MLAKRMIFSKNNTVYKNIQAQSQNHQIFMNTLSVFMKTSETSTFQNHQIFRSFV